MYRLEVEWAESSATASPRHWISISARSFLKQIVGITMSNSLTIIQSSSSQSALPVFRELMSSSKDRFLLFSFLYPPELFTPNQNDLTVFDWTDRIAGYSDKPVDLLENLPTGKPCVERFFWVLTSAVHSRRWTRNRSH